MSQDHIESVTADHGRVQPSTAADIVYKAFGRPYAGGSGQVINLFASCSYGTGAWKIYFVGDGNGGYTCMEQAPGFANEMITYYTATFTTGVGLATPVQSVKITDSHGEHSIPVEALS